MGLNYDHRVSIYKYIMMEMVNLTPKFFSGLIWLLGSSRRED